MKKHGERAKELQATQTEMIENYTPDPKLVPWAGVGPVQFPEPLTEVQKLCKKGAKFTEHDEDDGDIEFVVIGLEYDTAQKDYALYYIETEKESEVNQLCDDHSSYFKSGTTTSGHHLTGLNDMDIDWPA